MKNMILLSFTSIFLFTVTRIASNTKTQSYRTKQDESGTLSISGKVWDSLYGYPVKAWLYIYDLGNGTYRIKNILSGKFSFSLELGGNYKLVFKKSGYTDKSIEVLAFSGKKQNYMFEFDVYLTKPETDKQQKTTFDFIPAPIVRIYYDSALDKFTYIKP